MTVLAEKSRPNGMATYMYEATSAWGMQGAMARLMSSLTIEGGFRLEAAFDRQRGPDLPWPNWSPKLW